MVEPKVLLPNVGYDCCNVLPLGVAPKPPKLAFCPNWMNPTKEHSVFERQSGLNKQRSISDKLQTLPL